MQAAKHLLNIPAGLAQRPQTKPALLRNESDDDNWLARFVDISERALPSPLLKPRAGIAGPIGVTTSHMFHRFLQHILEK
jgi:hypothetical protein